MDECLRELLAQASVTKGVAGAAKVIADVILRVHRDVVDALRAEAARSNSPSLQEHATNGNKRSGETTGGAW